jgi:hypothetical protein
MISRRAKIVLRICGSALLAFGLIHLGIACWHSSDASVSSLPGGGGWVADFKIPTDGIGVVAFLGGVILGALSFLPFKRRSAT